MVFCFSKKRVDALADNLASLDLASSSDKSEVQVGHMIRPSPLHGLNATAARSQCSSAHDTLLVIFLVSPL